MKLFTKIMSTKAVRIGCVVLLAGVVAGTAACQHVQEEKEVSETSSAEIVSSEAGSEAAPLPEETLTAAEQEGNKAEEITLSDAERKVLETLYQAEEEDPEQMIRYIFENKDVLEGLSSRYPEKKEDDHADGRHAIEDIPAFDGKDLYYSYTGRGCYVDTYYDLDYDSVDINGKRAVTDLYYIDVYSGDLQNGLQQGKGLRFSISYDLTGFEDGSEWSEEARGQLINANDDFVARYSSGSRIDRRMNGEGRYVSYTIKRDHDTLGQLEGTVELEGTFHEGFCNGETRITSHNYLTGESTEVRYMIDDGILNGPDAYKLVLESETWSYREKTTLWNEKSLYGFSNCRLIMPDGKEGIARVFKDNTSRGGKFELPQEALKRLYEAGPGQSESEEAEELGTKQKHFFYAYNYNDYGYWTGEGIKDEIIVEELESGSILINGLEYTPMGEDNKYSRQTNAIYEGYMDIAIYRPEEKLLMRYANEEGDAYYFEGAELAREMRDSMVK